MQNTYESDLSESASNPFSKDSHFGMWKEQKAGIQNYT